MNIPLSDNVDTDALAEGYTFCGREIKNAVKNACVTAAMHDRDSVTQSDLLRTCEKVKTESENLAKADDHTQTTLKDLLQKKVDQQQTS